MMMPQLRGTKLTRALRLDRESPILYYRGSRKGEGDDRLGEEAQEDICSREPQLPVVVTGSRNCVTCSTGQCAMRTRVGTSTELRCSARSRR